MDFNLLPPDAANFPDPFPKGAVLLVDKPLGWTSFDVVNKVRHRMSRFLGVKRAKVGHAGTLDPLATGLLVLCLGDATKQIDLLQAQIKTYTGTIAFGATTPSFDLEKGVDNVEDITGLTDAQIGGALAAFRGDIEQVPPIYSAIKIDGRRVYKNARTGETVDMPARSVRVDTFECGPLYTVPADQLRPEPIILSEKGHAIWQHPDHPGALRADFRIVCSKGTYIRSLAHDLGQAVGCGAYLSSLRRTGSGDFDIKDAWTMEEIIRMTN